MEFLVALLAIGFLYVLLFWKTTVCFVVNRAGLTRSKFWVTWVSAFNFSGIEMSQALFSTTDILVLGFFVSAEQVGIYKVAAAAAALLLFPVASMSSVYAPRVALGFSKGEIRAINADMKRLSTGVFLLVLPLLIVFLFFPDWPLRVLFSETYIDAAVVLSILVSGIAVRLILGPVGWALAMTGHEHWCMRILLLGAAINLILNLLLIPPFGVIGAALGTMVATIITYLAMAIVLRTRTGIATWAFQTQDLRKFITTFSSGFFEH